MDGGFNADNTIFGLTTPDFGCNLSDGLPGLPGFRGSILYEI
jgi:hypothetical protein